MKLSFIQRLNDYIKSEQRLFFLRNSQLVKSLYVTGLVILFFTNVWYFVDLGHWLLDSLMVSLLLILLVAYFNDILISPLLLNYHVRQYPELVKMLTSFQEFSNNGSLKWLKRRQYRYFINNIDNYYQLAMKIVNTNSKFLNQRQKQIQEYLKAELDKLNSYYKKNITMSFKEFIQLVKEFFQIQNKK